MSEPIDRIIAYLRKASLEGKASLLYPESERSLREHLSASSNLAEEISRELDLTEGYEGAQGEEIKALYAKSLGNFEESALTDLDAVIDKYHTMDSVSRQLSLSTSSGQVSEVMASLEEGITQNNPAAWKNFAGLLKEIDTSPEADFRVFQPSDFLNSTAHLLNEIVAQKELLSTLRYDGNNAYEALFDAAYQLCEQGANSYFVEELCKGEQRQNASENRVSALESFNAIALEVCAPQLASIARYYGEEFEAAIQADIAEAQERGRAMQKVQKSLLDGGFKEIPKQPILKEILLRNAVKGGGITYKTLPISKSIGSLNSSPISLN